MTKRKGFISGIAILISLLVFWRCLLFSKQLDAAYRIIQTDTFQLVYCVLMVLLFANIIIFNNIYGSEKNKMAGSFCFAGIAASAAVPIYVTFPNIMADIAEVRANMDIFNEIRVSYYCYLFLSPIIVTALPSIANLITKK